MYISSKLVDPPYLIVELAKSYLITESTALLSDRIFKVLLLNKILVVVSSSKLAPPTASPIVSGSSTWNKPVAELPVPKYNEGAAALPSVDKFKNGVLTVFVPLNVILPLSSVKFPCPIVNAGSPAWTAVIVTKFPEALK